MAERRAAHLTDADVQRLRAALVKKRAEILDNQREAASLQRGVHDRETEQGDIAENQIEQASALGLGAVEVALLADVERALENIDHGHYGSSEDSGAPIPLERLEAIPWARRTAQEEERRGHRG